MNATRKCLENGTWYVHETFNLPWTNYTQCFSNNVNTETIVIVDVPLTNATKLVEVCMIHATGKIFITVLLQNFCCSAT